MQQQQQDLQGRAPAAWAHSGDSLVTLADASSHLRNMRQRLALIQSSAVPLPQFNPLPPRIDDRFTATSTKSRKSMTAPNSFNKFASEVYPIATPPIVDFISGDSSRLHGRDPRVVGA